MANSYTVEQDLTLVLADGKTYECHSKILARLHDVSMMMYTKAVEIFNGKKRLRLPPQLTSTSVEHILGRLYEREVPDLTGDQVMGLLGQTTTMRSVWQFLSGDLAASLEDSPCTLARLSDAYLLYEFYVLTNRDPTPHAVAALEQLLLSGDDRYCYTTPTHGRPAMATFIHNIEDTRSRLRLFATWVMNAPKDDITEGIVEEVARVAIGTRGDEVSQDYRTRVAWLHTHCGPSQPSILSEAVQASKSPERKREAESTPDRPSKKPK